MSLVLGLLTLCCSLLLQPTTSIPPEDFYPFGIVANDAELPSNDDGSTGPIAISIPFPFFSSIHTTIFVNNNGLISFDASVSSFTPQPFPLPGLQLIAPYWADVDTRNGGRVWYREASSEADLLMRIGNEIRMVLDTTFQPTFLFIATWDHVGFFGGGASNLTNTFQCILVSNGDLSFVMFLYADGLIQWTTGSASGGSGGLGGTEAQVGFNAGDGVRSASVPGSQTPDIINIASTTNVDRNGVWLFQVDQVVIIDDFVITFEQSLYEILEDIGVDNFALRICFNFSGVNTERIITIATESGTALGGEDYKELQQDITLTVGDGYRCVAIIIYEDVFPEMDECFEVVIEGTDFSSEVTILDDDDTPFRFGSNSPRVDGAYVFLNLTFGRAVRSAICSLLVRNRVQQEVDCTSGVAEFHLNRRSLLITPSITVFGRRGSSQSSVPMERNFRLGVRGRCSVHLIGDGITTVAGDSGMITVIDWGFSAPIGVARDDVIFECRLDGADPNECESPFMGVLTSGDHELQVRPSSTEGCEQIIARAFRIQVP